MAIVAPTQEKHQKVASFSTQPGEMQSAKVESIPLTWSNETMKRALMCLTILLFAYCSCMGNSQAADENKPVAVNPNGDSVLNGRIGGKTIRIILSAYKIDIGGQGQTPPRVRKTNCTYSSYPCSQVSNLSIWVGEKKLFVFRSVFADCADIGTMALTSAAGVNVLTLIGGDASEGYTVKVFFDDHRVKKRELYADEANSLVETTTYMPPAVLN
jgi:hypothetical protein